MATEDNQPVNYSPCLICSSPVITPDIKLEPDFDQDCQSDITFLLTTVLEIPQNELEHHQEKLINQQLSISYCESCTKLIYSSKQTYTEILELSRKFRKVQRQIVQQISNSSSDLHHNSTLLTSNHHGLLEFCRNFLTKHDFNGFGYPFVVNRIPINSNAPSAAFQEHEPSVDNVKEEPFSENEDHNEDYNYGSDDDLQKSAPASSDSEDSQNESDSDFEPPKSSPTKYAEDDKNNEDSYSSASEDSEEPLPPPPPKRRRAPPKKTRGPQTGKTQAERARKAAILSSNPLSANKRGFVKPLSKFERLHPNYPKLLPDPITSNFHCGEPSCSKFYPRKASLERHILVEHLQDNFYKCSQCDKSFASKETYEDHTSWHANLPRWKCQEKVTTKTTTTSGEGVNLQQCTEQFFSRKKLRRHIQQVHNEESPIICEICGKRLSCKEYLSTHKHLYHKDNSKEDYRPIDEPRKKKESGPSIQICNYCGKIFKSKPNLVFHVNLMHEKNVGKFGCQFCEWKFNRKIWLQQHLWRKHDKFSLDGYTPPPPTPRKGSSVKNKQTQPNLKKTSPATVKTYWQTRKPFQCEVKGCKLGFCMEKTLKKHMEEKHGGNKEGGGGGVFYQFLCKYCGKGFHFKFKKDLHEEAHENKETKPFGCEICGKKFAVMHYLNIHVSNIHRNGNGDGASGSKKAKKVRIKS